MSIGRINSNSTRQNSLYLSMNLEVMKELEIGNIGMHYLVLRRWWSGGWLQKKGSLSSLHIYLMVILQLLYSLAYVQVTYLPCKLLFL